MGRGGNPVSNMIYVANRLSDKVTVIDGRTNRACSGNRRHSRISLCVHSFFYSTLGHVEANWDRPEMQTMIVEAIKWALKLVNADVTPRAAR